MISCESVFLIKTQKNVIFFSAKSCCSRQRTNNQQQEYDRVLKLLLYCSKTIGLRKYEKKYIHKIAFFTALHDCTALLCSPTI